VTAILEAGSGVGDSFMTANIHVLNGMSWYGGRLQPTSTQQDFIWAFSPNVPSGGASGNLKQHVSVGSFQLDLTSAIGAGGTPVIVSPATSSGWSSIVLAHAVMMGVAWVAALPAGAIIIRFLDHKVRNPVLIHQILQLSSFVIIFIAFFVGVGIFSLLLRTENRGINWTKLCVCPSMAWVIDLSWIMCSSSFGMVSS
jgi:F0F1-type ATP synthase membrane subunit c/vacuolar-type H+-ATPase subunit K